MTYINIKNFDGTIETVDFTMNNQEAEYLLQEYLIAFGSNVARVYKSKRATKDFYN
jgi:hypothetical protein